MTANESPVQSAMQSTERPSSRSTIGEVHVGGAAMPRCRDLAPGKRWTVEEVDALERKLWGGFSERALADLRRIRYSRFAEPRVKARTAWALARYAYAHQRYEEALQHISFELAADPATRGSKRAALLEVDLLCKLGMVTSALASIEHVRARKPEDPDLILAHVNVLRYLAREWTQDFDDHCLSLLNEIYARFDLAPLRKAESDKPLCLDNLVADVAAAGREDAPRISVIVPVHNAESTIALALRSLLSQTWRNIEVIVVDDCSVDNTAGVVEEVARHDDRVRLVRHQFNQGAYAARNTGLRLASGQFVTTHDGDDWSHPEKLERQVLVLLQDGDAIGTVSYWARVTPDFMFCGPSRPVGKYIERNHSSLMLRREVFDVVGSWDRVRVAADTELIWRLQRIYGQDAIKNVFPDVPLSFALTLGDSLTRSRDTHVWTINYGLRREYRESSAYWHRNSPNLKLEPEGERAFPAPAGNLFEAGARESFDILIVSDFSAGAHALNSALQYIRAARALGLSTAVAHWPCYRRDVTLPVTDAVRGLAHKREVRVMCPGEALRADTVIVCSPLCLEAVPDRPPQVEAERLFVVVSRLPHRFGNGRDIQYDPIECRRNLSKVFGAEGIWIPVSKRVRELMCSDGRFPAAAPCDWTPMLAVEDWKDVVRVRGDRKAGHRRPIIGRHMIDDFRKWPSVRRVLAAAYCAGADLDVRFLGGASVARQRLGTWPANWNVDPYTDNEGVVRSFLEELDFFVCFPHEALIPEFGRSLAEAMAAGVPVIASPVFESSFGSAAIYCNPEEVADTVRELWSDERRYMAQVEAGLEFVRRECDISLFEARLRQTDHRTMPRDSVSPSCVAT